MALEKSQFAPSHLPLLHCATSFSALSFCALFSRALFSRALFSRALFSRGLFSRALPSCVLSFCVGFANPVKAAEEPALVDPTRPVAFVAPLGKAEQEEKKLQLQAIFTADGKRKAVINGQTVKVGEFVNQAKILAIDSGRVRFIKNGEKGEVVLLPTVLQPAKVEE